MTPKNNPKRGGWSGGPVSGPSRRGVWLILAVGVAVFVVAVSVWMAKQ